MLLETVYSWKRVGKSYAQKETARNEFSECLGIWGLLSPYFLTVGDKNRERKYQHLALRFKREEEVANLVREVKVLPEEVCFHLPWSWVGCFDVWNLSTFKIVRSGRKVSNRRKKMFRFALILLKAEALQTRLSCEAVLYRNIKKAVVV